MDTKIIHHFLRQIAANNNREWFLAHKQQYLESKTEFEAGIAEAIARIATFDEEISHLQVKDCTYRFYRDIRFSPNKSPYKRHFGAYICAKGKKALRGGYYIHVEPGNSLLATGSYWLPTHILTSCRNEIMSNIDEWRKIVENKEFVEYFGQAGDGVWEKTDKGFGLASLKNAPSGFPRDYEHLNYLRLKDYCCWCQVPDHFFESKNWLEQMEKIFKTAKPMMDFMNAVIDDYE